MDRQVSTMSMYSKQPSMTVSRAPYAPQPSMVPSKQGSMTGNRLSSHVLSEQYLSAPPAPGVKYVEVPVIEEVIKHVPKKEVVEVERIVPRIEYEYVDRVVEVPQVHIIDKHVEVPQVHEVLRHIPRHEVVEVPREVVITVPRVETKLVEKVVEVRGEVIEVPKPYIVENKIPVARYIDREVPTIVAQTVQPIVTESNEVVDVDVYEFEPTVIPVDVIVPKPIPSTLVSKGVVNEQHRPVNVPAAQYNSILKQLNAHLTTNPEALPFIKDASGAISFVEGHIGTRYVAPVTSAQIQGFRAPAMQMANTFQMTQTTMPSAHQRHIGSSTLGDPTHSIFSSPIKSNNNVFVTAAPLGGDLNSIYDVPSSHHRSHSSLKKQKPSKTRSKPRRH